MYGGVPLVTTILDPSEYNTFGQVVEVAQCVYSVLQSLGIPSFCKTSGSRGLHIMIPLKGNVGFGEARSFVEKVCLKVESILSDLTSTKRNKNARRQKIYLDFMQNCYGQTLASVYCVRPVAGAATHTRPNGWPAPPIRWRNGPCPVPY